ncbi:MAG: lycopene cyclase family protein [Flavobacteriaceae bacterium]|nr:lycopene cyclase family protein [Flavobacteriaceae bacterium]
MKQNYFDFIICGAGASGLLLLKAIREDSFFNEKSILIIEKEIKNVNDRTWSYWESPNGSFDSILSKKWSKANFCSEDFDSDFDLNPYQYKMLRSAGFYQSIQNKYSKLKNTIFLHAEVKNIDSKNIMTEVITSEGKFQSKKVFNSLFDPKPMINQKKYPVLQQHFVGWFIKTKKPSFDSSKVFFMDFNIPQVQETRFIYVLPIDKHNALVEYTLFSENLLHFDDYETGIKAYLDSKGITEYEIKEKEQGNIPMTCFPFEKINCRSLLHIGTAGGWTKASTGYTFMNTRRNIERLIPFLKTGAGLNTFTIKNRFRFYDLLFLDVLNRYNARGSKLFTRMFEKNPPVRIFRFLDEKTTFIEEFKIMASFSLTQKIWFLKALFKRIF